MPNPVVIATWPFGQTAARAALPLLRQGRPALDAAIAGAQAVEDDPHVHSVGYGGLPNAVGVVQLDACVMDGRTLGCGAVGGVENVRHVAALARRVLERTPHIFLVGQGAQQFALQQGFALETLLTSESLTEWERRRPRERPAPAPAPRPQAGPSSEESFSHDTVTVLALDQHGNLGGACSTSGLAHKLPGRVGDSPLIGAGLYADNSAGAAGATGVGEEIIRVGGSFLIAELMRAGRSPQEACEAVVRRVNEVAVRRNTHPAQVAFLALDARGRTGAACTSHTNFQYAVGTGERVELLRAREIAVESR
jgi:isoaspartyl peptidase/L-asparaginase-like protein (Ntn-hydrolase superfamily)